MKPIKPSERFDQYVTAMLACGHWEVTGRVIGKAHPEIRHIKTGQTLAYQIHDGGSDYNSSRNFAADAQKICGCRFIGSRGRKRSRKRLDGSGFRMPQGATTPAWVGAAWEERGSLTAQLDALRVSPTRSAIQEAAHVIERLSQVESNLRGAFQAPPEGGWRV